MNGDRCSYKISADVDELEDLTNRRLDGLECRKSQSYE